MNYIVLDMEWNQPTSKQSKSGKPAVLQGEIIQIGAVKLDENFQYIDNFMIMVQPKYYRRMHKKVSRLTKIKEEDLKLGFPFKVAIKHFRAWCGEEISFLTWGTDDIEVLRENMNIYKMDSSWIPVAYDVQFMFDYLLTKEMKRYSLDKAMGIIGEQPFPAHNALYDAKNTACVCRYLDMKKGIAEYYDSISRNEYYREGDFLRSIGANDNVKAQSNTMPIISDFSKSFANGVDVCSNTEAIQLI